MGFLDELKKMTRPYDDDDEFFDDEDEAIPVAEAAAPERPAPARPAAAPRRPAPAPKKSTFIRDDPVTEPELMLWCTKCPLPARPPATSRTSTTTRSTSNSSL